MKKLVLTLAVFMMSLAAAQDAPEGFPITIKDGLGQELTFHGPVERVVCFYNQCFGMMAALGVKPVAARYGDDVLNDPYYFNGEVEDIPVVPWTDSANAEAVAALEPDLIVGYGPEEAETFKGVAAFYAEQPFNDLEGLYTELRALGKAMGLEERAEAAIQSFEARLAAYVKLSPKDAGTVMKLGVVDQNTFDIASTNDITCQLLNLVATCGWSHEGDPTYWSYQTSVEGLLALDPDVLLPLNWSEFSDAELWSKLEASALWNELTAVKNNRLLRVEGYSNPIASTIPGATKFLDKFMPLLYPDIFPEPLTDEQVEEILAGEN